MKPNIKSPYFATSITCYVIAIAQLFLAKINIQRVITDQHPATLAAPHYWIGVLLVALGFVSYYKTTKYKQSLSRLLVVFAIAAIVAAPIVAILYVTIVLLPLYQQVNTLGF